jgi:hypothetical protein
LSKELRRIGFEKSIAATPVFMSSINFETAGPNGIGVLRVATALPEMPFDVKGVVAVVMKVEDAETPISATEDSNAARRVMDTVRDSVLVEMLQSESCRARASTGLAVVSD